MSEISGFICSIIHYMVSWLSMYSQEFSPAQHFKSIINFSILLVQNPTFTSIKCHRECHRLYYSDLHRCRYVMALEHLFQGHLGRCTKWQTATYFLTAFSFAVDDCPSHSENSFFFLPFCQQIHPKPSFKDYLINQHTVGLCILSAWDMFQIYSLS